MSDLRAFRTLARNWEAFGDVDPLFGVLSDPAKFGGKWDADEFFASGRAHVENLLRTLAGARATFEAGACLDFGCGVGRLTVPLADSFRHTVGVDVARPMIDAARRHRPPSARCEFVLNRDPHLGRFARATFDMIHSCLVLQHIPPEFACAYVGEFFRVAKPGGLVVFQVPALVRTEHEITAAHALPDGAFAAEIGVLGLPHTLEAGANATVAVRVTNRSDIVWRQDIPAGRHICLGNHWLSEDGSEVMFDDGRAFLPHAIAPGETAGIQLKVRAPASPGRYILEIDLVQEHVTWFAQKGSPTSRTLVEIAGSASPPATAMAERAEETGGPVALPRRPSLLRRLVRRWRGGTPAFEMHVVPRETIEDVIAKSGGRLLKAVDDNAAGPGWLSYTYICRKN